MRRAVLAALLVGASGCATQGVVDVVEASERAVDWREAEREVMPPERTPLTQGEAELYVLALVNKARAEHDLEPVYWDATAARAAARHAKDVAAHGFTAHVGTDGSVPELRYTEAGGSGLVMENVGCFGDNAERTVDPEATFEAATIEHVESMFLNEVPPHDGHRKNILARRHTGVGISVTGTKNLEFACITEEFVDDYGSYAPLPRRAAIGQTIRVAGELKAPARIAGVGISRVDLPRPHLASALNNTGDYPIPKPFATYFGKGWQTPKPVEIHKNAFFVEVSLGDEPGLYGVSVWASFDGPRSGSGATSTDGGRALEMVSLRTIEVR